MLPRLSLGSNTAPSQIPNTTSIAPTIHCPLLHPLFSWVFCARYALTSLPTGRALSGYDGLILMGSWCVWLKNLMKITDQQPATREHLTRHGTIEYQIDSAAFPSGIWGRERFTITRHSNGDRVLRAFCELDDEPALIRDVIQRVDAEFHTQDCIVRLTEDGAFKGSTWYHITDEEITYQGLSSTEGRISGQLAIDRTIRGFGTHALNSDAWLVARFDRSEGPCQRTFYNSPLTSLDHRGATGPALECSQGTTIEYFGE